MKTEKKLRKEWFEEMIGKWTWLIIVVMIIWIILEQIAKHMEANKQLPFIFAAIFALFFGMVLEEAKYFSKEDPFKEWEAKRKWRLRLSSMGLAAMVVGFFILFSA